ncbi:MAG: hypothetical protein V2A34_03285 [Lentisphaerota bacterium]
MKLSTKIAAVLALSAPLFVFAQEPVQETAPVKEEPKTLALVAVGQIDEQMVERVRKFAEDNIFFPVRILPARELFGNGLDNEGREAARSMDPRDVGLVALVMTEEDIPSHGVFLPKERVAVVNAKVIQPNPANDELYFKRLRKGTMRGYGLLLGMETCPNPQCCMAGYTTLEQLDSIGNNFCPPCYGKVEAACSAAGLKMLEFPTE